MALAVLLTMGYAGFCLAGPREMDPVCRQSLENVDLSEEQQVQVRAVYESFLAEVNPLQGSLMVKRTELQRMWADAHPDEARILAKQTEISEVMARIHEIRTKHQLRCRKILNQNQGKALVTHTDFQGGR